METECFADGSPITTVFSNRKRTKILAAFVSERDREITVSYAAQLAGVARSTVYNHLDDLEEMGVIEEVDMGDSSLWTLTDSDLAHELYRLEGIALKTRSK